MPMTNNPKDTGTFENAADKAAFESISAARAAGEDVFGDYDPPANAAEPVAVAAEVVAEVPAIPVAEVPQAPVVEVPAVVAAPAAPPPPAPEAAAPAAPSAPAAPAAPVPPVEAEVVAAAPVATPAPVPTAASAPQFRTPTGAELAKSKGELIKEKSEAFKKYSDGDMTAEEYSAVDSKVMLGLLDVGRNEALLSANEQTANQTQEQAIAALVEKAEGEGQISYRNDPKASVQFNAAVEGLMLDPDAKNLAPTEFYAEAHRIVLARRGLLAAPATPAPTPAVPAVPVAAAPVPPAPSRAAPPAPVTLRDLPTASTPNTNGSREEQLSRLASTDPLAFQATIGNMDRNQRNAWMDS